MKSNVVPAIIAVVCVVGIGIAGAALFSPQAPGASGDQTIVEPKHPLDLIGDGITENDPNEDPDPPRGPPDGGTSWSNITTCVEPLDTPLGLLGTFSIFLFLVSLTYYRWNFAVSLLSAWTIFPPIMLAYFLLTDCAGGGGGGWSPKVGGPSAGILGESVVSETLVDSALPVSDVPVWVVPVMGGGIVLGAAFLLYRTATTDDVVVPEAIEDDEPDLDSFARAAGRAADRIECRNADVDNAVYQAWLEMTTLLDVEDPETYTPGEFADAAVDLGMAEAHVSELTTLFNEVRYGGKDADSREDRAVAVLRNIESEYGRPADHDNDAAEERNHDNDTTEEQKDE